MHGNDPPSTSLEAMALKAASSPAALDDPSSSGVSASAGSTGADSGASDSLEHQLDDARREIQELTAKASVDRSEIDTLNRRLQLADKRVSDEVARQELMERHEKVQTAQLQELQARLLAASADQPGDEAAESSDEAAESPESSPSTAQQRRGLSTGADSDAKPKRAPTAYNLFIRDKMAELRESDPALSPQVAMQMAAAAWPDYQRANGIDTASKTEQLAALAAKLEKKSEEADVFQAQERIASSESPS